MKNGIYIAAIASIALFSCRTDVDAVEIKGTVRSATAPDATIATEGEFHPNVGDPVQIFFKLSGTDSEISVGNGKVTAVHGDSVEAKIDKVTGTVSKDQLARITSEKPQKRSAASAAAGSPTSATGDGRNPTLAFVDMNKLFKEHPKTKEAEAKINADKTAAKDEYDERAKAYRALLDQINELNRQIGQPGTSASLKTQFASDRDAKITGIKAMERSILEFKNTREKELQDEASKMRGEIVSDIAAHIKQLGGQTVNAIFDVSGMSLNAVPLLVHYPQASDASEPVISALNGRAPSTFSSTHEVKIAGVDMNNIFKSLPKTKASEAEINSAKNVAKKEYDKKAEQYKKDLARIDSLSGSARDKQTAKVREMERTINEWRTAREKELQDQAIKFREEIVVEMTSAINALVANEPLSLVLDTSGMTLNGGPAIFTRQIPDFSGQIVALVDKTGKSSGTAASTTKPFASSAALRFGCVDTTRAFKAMPESKQADSEINVLKENAKSALANADAATRQRKEQELQNLAQKKRGTIVQKLGETVRQLAETGNFNVIFDTSGNTLNGVPLVVSTRDLPDLTDEVISRASRP